MPTLPDSGVSFTVQTNGQTLVVAAGTSASSLVQTLYSDAACTSSVTTPATITSDTTYYLPLDVANVAHYISCKQPDGTELWGKKQHLGGITIAPLPTAAQVGADLATRDPRMPTGAIAETFSRTGAIGNSAIPSSGRMILSGIRLTAGITVSSITFISGTTALSAGTNQWFALYDSAYALLGQTANDTSTAWGANTAKTLSFATPIVTTASGVYYCGLMVAASTPPTLMGITTNVASVGVTPKLSLNADTGLTTTAPATANSSTALSLYAYAYVS